MDAIKVTINSVELDVEIVDDAGERKLVFDPSTPGQPVAILRLRDEDYLRSLMTQELYEASEKIQLG